MASLCDGDTLISANEIELYIKDCLAADNHQLPYNYLMSNKEFIEEKTVYLNTDDRCALQLKEYKEIDDYLVQREIVNRPKPTVYQIKPFDPDDKDFYK